MNLLKKKHPEWISEKAIPLSLLKNLSPKKSPLNGHHKTIIVIPSFNEEASIGQVLEDIKKHA
ncbi:MAG: glycosyltransferase family 2 protein, partial [Nitrospinaceae bacterium]